MADLLECLLQIKGLRESAPRLARFASDTTARGAAAFDVVAETAARLAVAECRWLSALVAALPHLTDAAASEAAGSAGSEGTADAMAAFERMRRSALEILDRCTAADFAARAALPGRGRIAVADIVAHMLAHDTERLAELKAALNAAHRATGS